MTQHLDSKKVKLIAAITEMSPDELNDLEKYINIHRLSKEHGHIFNNMRKTISVEELKKEQNYQGFDREKFNGLVTELDIQEPIEDLLAMLD